MARRRAGALPSTAPALDDQGMPFAPATVCASARPTQPIEQSPQPPESMRSCSEVGVLPLRRQTLVHQCKLQGSDHKTTFKRRCQRGINKALRLSA